MPYSMADARASLEARSIAAAASIARGVAEAADAPAAAPAPGVAPPSPSSTRMEWTTREDESDALASVEGVVPNARRFADGTSPEWGGRLALDAADEEEAPPALDAAEEEGAPPPGVEDDEPGVGLAKKPARPICMPMFLPSFGMLGGAGGGAREGV